MLYDEIAKALRQETQNVCLTSLPVPWERRWSFDTRLAARRFDKLIAQSCYNVYREKANFIFRIMDSLGAYVPIVLKQDGNLVLIYFSDTSNSQVRFIIEEDGCVNYIIKNPSSTGPVRQLPKSSVNNTFTFLAEHVTNEGSE